MAAESGAQRKLNEIFSPGGVVNTGACAAFPPYTFGVNGIEGCSNTSVNVTCNFVTVDAVNYFTIRSEGSCGPLGDQAFRIIEVQAKDGL